MVMKKRGLSDVVAVTLIILLAIAAVVIVWAFVSNMLRSTGEELEAVCLSVDVKPINCNATTGDVLVRYDAGDNALTNVKLIFYTVAGTSTSAIPAPACALNVLDSKLCDALPAQSAGAINVAVAGMYLNDAGEEKTCPASTDKATCTA